MKFGYLLLIFCLALLIVAQAHLIAYGQAAADRGTATVEYENGTVDRFVAVWGYTTVDGRLLVEQQRQYDRTARLLDCEKILNITSSAASARPRRLAVPD